MFCASGIWYRGYLQLFLKNCKGEIMKNLGFVIFTWVIMTVAVVFIHIHYVGDHLPVSDCHLAEIKMYHDRPMCTECKLFCEVRK
tara:strand:- start:3193 stop:3447 length:255 start_codon:yes stop_codon:yes gene_type:complete